MQRLTAIGLAAWIAGSGISAQNAGKQPGTVEARSAKDRAIEFCRIEALTRLEFLKTMEWLDLAKEEPSGTWFVSGIRTAKSPAGPVDQQYACRVLISSGTLQLKMIQVFRGSSKTGKDVFELRRRTLPRAATGHRCPKAAEGRGGGRPLGPRKRRRIDQSFSHYSL